MGGSLNFNSVLLAGLLGVHPVHVYVRGQPELDSFMQILGLPHSGSLSYGVVPYFPAVMMVLHSVFWFFKPVGL